MVRKTLRDLFKPVPQGEPGNDDLGATSSWVVFANLGLYPEIPGIAGFTVSSPVFPQVTLKLGEHVLQIIASGAPDKLYIKTVEVDGKTIHNWWVSWDALKLGGKLEFLLSSQPDKNPGEAPPSFSP